jgi:hypothetical protein
VDHPLRPITTGWIAKIKLALDYKRERFGIDADEAMRFYNGPYNFMYGMKYRTDSPGFAYSGDADTPSPQFQMTVNKVAEMVQLFGPVLYHKNPNRQVSPRKEPMVPPEILGDPNDPNVQQMFGPMIQQLQSQRAVDAARASLLEAYLNYTPTALNLKDESRWAIDEALIKGCGLLWTELYTPVGGTAKLVGSFYDSVDNLVIDCDMESIKDAKWIAKRCVKPVWEVEEIYGLERGSLKGNLESYNAQAETNADPNGMYKRAMGRSNDLLEYWEVYSKMGMGARLTGVDPALRDTLDAYGNYCYLVVCDSIPYPLNVPPQVIDAADDQQVFLRVQWPTPFWADDSWPFSPLVFHQVPRQVWPMSHLKPAMGELKFINWAYSFIATKIKTACRDLIVCQKSLGEEIKNAILHGTDYELIELEAAHGTISEVVQFLSHPSFQGDIWKVIQAVEMNFEKRVGLTELMYGMSASSLRSATEAQVKNEQLQVRPGDMANKVEDWMTEVSRKEALAARWHLQAQQDIQPVLGPMAAWFWQQIMTTADPNEVIHQLEYRIEAGSIRKPNRDRDVQNMKDALQNLFQPLFQYAMTAGNVGPVNALLTGWAKSLDFDAKDFLLQPPPPPMPPGAGPGPGPQQAPPQRQPATNGRR